MQEIVSNLALANSELLELDFWGSWKLLFCNPAFFFYPELSLLCSLVLFPLLFFFYIHFAFLLLLLLPSSSLLLLLTVFFDLLFFIYLCKKISLTSKCLYWHFQGLKKIVNGWPWLQVSASICLELCTKMINSLINVLDFFGCGFNGTRDCRITMNASLIS